MWFVRFRNVADALPTGLAAPLYRAEDGSECCVYLDDRGDLARVRDTLAVVRLERLREVAGCAHALAPEWHYVVATDVSPSAEADFNAWYDEEHLPGLASVPGTARAARYRVVEGPGPLYHAGYDLAERCAFNSPAWLAVRATPWSSRVRPNFLNTRRTMYRRVA